MRALRVLLLLAACAAVAQAAPPDDLRPGLPYVLFNSDDLQRPAEHGLDPAPNMALAGYNDCSRLWLGWLKLPAAEVTLEAEVAQGVRLYVDGKCVIDKWNEEGTHGGTVRAGEGKPAPLRVEYRHLGGEAYLRLYWSWLGHERELVPPEAFCHRAADAAHALALAEDKEHVGPGNLGPYPAVVSAPAGDEESCASLYQPGQSGRVPEDKPLRLGPGPHLLIDDYLISEASGIRRVVVRPERDSSIPNPIITGPEDRCFQPYLTVVRDAQTGLFRVWYGMYTMEQDVAASHVGYMTSKDGIHWDRPARELPDPAPIQFGDSVIDEGAGYRDPARRFKLGFWKDGGLKIATSPDGLTWEMLAPHVVLRHNHDIVNIFRDALRRRYVTTLSVYTTGPTWSGLRRVSMQSTSRDLLNWSKPWYILTPQDGIDQGETQFYCMNGHLIRGDLWIGLVKVLRDDLKAPGTPQGAYGVGYTTLAWSRDGRHWVRDREPFFEPDPSVEAWDHAHAWIDYQLPVGDQVYLYYGGYKSGHKMNRFAERQIGLLRIPRDRYVAREAEETTGTITTPPLVLRGKALTVNADITGELRVRVLSEKGAPMAGCDYTDCQPIKGNAVAHAVHWRRPLASVQGRPVRLQFRLRQGRLFGFDLLAV